MTRNEAARTGALTALPAGRLALVDLCGSPVLRGKRDRVALRLAIVVSRNRPKFTWCHYDRSRSQPYLLFTQGRKTREFDSRSRTFATACIEKGEIVVVKGGYVLTRNQRNRISRELGPSEIQISEELFIGPATQSEREGGMMHLNHSCEPNLGLQGQIVYVALRDIGIDQELTFDYAMTDDEPCEMICRCGTGTCRGTITGADWQRLEIQRKYDGYFSWFIQRRIDASKKLPPLCTY